MRDDTDGKSRSQKKRESAEARRLGAVLAALPSAVLRGLPIPALLLEAMLDWKKFSGHEPKRRQMQYIGRLMRELDETEAEALEAFAAPGRENARTPRKANPSRPSRPSRQSS